MDSYPNPNFNFVDLLQSQQESGFGLESSSFPLFGTQATEGSNFEQDSPAAAERKERRTWTPTHDAVLISAWLHTSKDPVVGNEQRSVAFWKRIAAYYSASPKIAECDKREASTCKQRWHKINDLVCKFCGAFEAANRAKSSGTLNDINVLDRSPVFDDVINGQAPQVTYSVNGREYHMAYYLTDGIYPKLATFIQYITMPQEPKAVLFAQRQEAVRKDVERAFGVLQARFAIVKNPVLFWDTAKIGKIMRACIILHNMIVENERDGYTLFDVSEFQQEDETWKLTCRSHVFYRYSFKYRKYDGCSN
uniref:Myb-like domain-containing protein n=1 Tax=Brassica oleracea var. oleracea TaxID=109376 RepID=A0A0D3DSI6_BRAOL